MNKLYRSNHDVKVAGVCGGIGERYQIDPTLVRLGTVAATLISGGSIALLYLAAAVLVPKNPDSLPKGDADFPYTAPPRGFSQEARTMRDAWMTEEEQHAIRAKINHLRAKIAKYENTRTEV